MLGAFIFSVFFGFLAAAIAHQIFRQVLRFRAEWTSTFIACMMTCLVAGAAFVCMTFSTEKGDEFATLKILGITFAITLVTGLLAFRLIIKSESGRSPSWLVSGLSSFALCAPPLLCLSVLSMVNFE